MYVCLYCIYVCGYIGGMAVSLCMYVCMNVNISLRKESYRRGLGVAPTGQTHSLDSNARYHIRRETVDG